MMKMMKTMINNQTKSIQTIPLALNKTIADFGIPLYIQWNIEGFPHMVIFSSTGSGKTYALRLILGKIALYVPNAQLTVCDFKGDDDFSFLNGNPSFYHFMDVSKGLESFLNILKERQSGADKSIPQFLVFDEYAAFLTSLDKKSADATKQSMSSLLMLGRSFNLHVIVSQQRLDAKYFENARDNFSVVIGMGRISKESVEMMFSDFKDEVNRNKGRGEGTLLLGADLFDILIPIVCNQRKLEACIQSIMTPIKN